MTNPFVYVKSIQTTKENLIVDNESEKEYIPFLTNRALSNHIDSVLYAQEMNLLNGLDKKLQYDYFLNTIRAKKRQFVPWAKKKENSDIALIQEYYGYSYSKAKTAASILSDEQIKIIKETLDKGGIK